MQRRYCRLNPAFFAEERSFNPKSRHEQRKPLMLMLKPVAHSTGYIRILCTMASSEVGRVLYRSWGSMKVGTRRFGAQFFVILPNCQSNTPITFRCLAKNQWGCTGVSLTWCVSKMFFHKFLWYTDKVSPMISLSYLQKEMACNVARPGGNILSRPVDFVPHFFWTHRPWNKMAGRPTAAFLLLESHCCEVHISVTSNLCFFNWNILTHFDKKQNHTHTPNH